jgi:hypothetical protein
VRIDTAAARLYRLDTTTGAVTRTSIPFQAVSLELDRSTGTPWVLGSGRIAKLTGTTLSIYNVSGAWGPTAGPDADGRIWFPRDDRTLGSFNIRTGTEETFFGSGPGFDRLDVDENGDIWALATGMSQLIRFRPSTAETTVYPFVLSQANWAGLKVSSGVVAIAAAYGPHFVTCTTATLDGGVPLAIYSRSTTTPSPTTQTAETAAFTASRTDDTLPYDERVVYAESDGGRHVFTTSGFGFNSTTWSGGGEVLTGGGPVQWWKPIGASETFQTRAVLPAVVEVRPDEPTTNFFTEVTVTNVDANGTVALTLSTSDAEYTWNLSLAAGKTRSFSNVVQAFRDSGIAIPRGDLVAGTLTATFTNGKGMMQARVYTRFPDGSSTGTGYAALDPTAELLVYRKSLNGLKQTTGDTGYRTNVAVANLCGKEGACPTLSLSANFFDDATGQLVGTTDFQVPPGQWSQKNAPLSAFAGATGETFSVIFVPYQSGATAYDAYATVIYNGNQDAAFVRANAVGSAATISLPVVVDANGEGTRWVSEAAITNTSGGESTADVTFTTTTGATVSEVLTLPQGRGVLWRNAVDHFRQIDPSKVPPDAVGSVRIAIRNYQSGFASSRTTATNRTGLGFAAVEPFLQRALRRKRITGLKQTSGFRTNLAVVHTGATTSDPQSLLGVAVTVTDKDGIAIGQPLTVTLSPGQLKQWTRILSDYLSVAGEGYVATIERTSGLDAFDAYITVIDATTSDPTFLRAE